MSDDGPWPVSPWTAVLTAAGVALADVCLIAAAAVAWFGAGADEPWYRLAPVAVLAVCALAGVVALLLAVVSALTARQGLLVAVLPLLLGRPMAVAVAVVVIAVAAGGAAGPRLLATVVGLVVVDAAAGGLAWWLCRGVIRDRLPRSVPDGPAASGDAGPRARAVAAEEGWDAPVSRAG